MKCISCGKEFCAADSSYINEDYLGSVACPYCCYVQDIDSDNYSLFISAKMRYENPIEYKRYCIRHGLPYLIGV